MSTVLPVVQAHSMSDSIFQPRGRHRIDLDRPRTAPTTSWLVSKHGVALFVTQSQSFMRWFIETNPGAVMEEVTGNVDAAAARTAR